MTLKLKSSTNELWKGWKLAWYHHFTHIACAKKLRGLRQKVEALPIQNGQSLSKYQGFGRKFISYKGNNFLGFLSFMPPVVSHYSVLPLGISTAKKCHRFVRHILKIAIGYHYCDLKYHFPCYNYINTYGPTCQLSLYLTSIKCGAYFIPTTFLFSYKIIAWLLLTNGATLIIVR